VASASLPAALDDTVGAAGATGDGTAGLAAICPPTLSCMVSSIPAIARGCGMDGCGRLPGMLPPDGRDEDRPFGGRRGGPWWPGGSLVLFIVSSPG
jgi:hypothetical protein